MTPLVDTNNSAYLIGWAVGLIIWIGSIVWTVSIARKKDRRTGLWGVLAFFFTVWALLVVAILPSRRTAAA